MNWQTNEKTVSFYPSHYFLSGFNFLVLGNHGFKDQFLFLFALFECILLNPFIVPIIMLLCYVYYYLP